MRKKGKLLDYIGGYVGIMTIQLETTTVYWGLWIFSVAAQGINAYRRLGSWAWGRGSFWTDGP